MSNSSSNNKRSRVDDEPCAPNCVECKSNQVVLPDVLVIMIADDQLEPESGVEGGSYYYVLERFPSSANVNPLTHHIYSIAQLASKHVETQLNDGEHHDAWAGIVDETSDVAQLLGKKVNVAWSRLSFGKQHVEFFGFDRDGFY